MRCNTHQIMSFEDFVDERILVSRDALGTKEVKLKLLEVEDDTSDHIWRFGVRVKVKKILITIKHINTQQIEEGECDLHDIEKEMKDKRHYSSTNRWIPTTDIKNGYIVNSRHASLLADAVALDYVTI